MQKNQGRPRYSFKDSVLEENHLKLSSEETIFNVFKKKNHLKYFEENVSAVFKEKEKHISNLSSGINHVKCFL